MPPSVQTPASAPEVVTQESLLLTAVERVARIREGRLAVHLHLSELRPANRQEAHLRIAVRMLEPLVQFYRAQIFLLEDGDVVILCKDVRPVDLDNVVYRLRALFSKDPLTYRDEGDGRDRFFTWYDLDYEYDDFLALAQRLADAARRRQRNRPPPPLPGMQPGDLHEVMAKLADVSVGPLVRRQSAVQMAERNRAVVVFQEAYVSIAELQRVLSPEVDLLGNRWLFQHLTQPLDLALLKAVAEADLQQLPPALSLNLNVPTLHTPEFEFFAATMAARAVGLVVELQVIDVFSDLGGYFYARDMLREKGHRLLLDGVTGLMLQFVDLEKYDADLVKLFWSPDFLDPAVGDEVRQAVAPIGLERIVLGRCDSEAAIQWGLDGGIGAFQGRYVDAMQAAVAMAFCRFAARCTLPQCIQRHGVVAGRPRSDCHDRAMLDSFPELRAPRRKAAAEAET